MDRKSFGHVEVKAADKGEVTAVIATLDVVDKDGDVTSKSAFVDGTPVVISAYGHTSWGGTLPVGKGVIRTTKGEALLDGQFFMDTQTGSDTFKAVKSLAESGLGEWSYGYDPVKFSYGEVDGKQVRFLEEVKVYEASPVLLGAGENTRTLSAKGMGLRFGEQADAVVAALKAYRERSAEVVAMRMSKGKTIGAEHLEAIEEIEAEVKRLRETLTPQVEESLDVSGEFVRFIQQLSYERI